jgi:DNA topoisomerase II
MSWKNNMQVDQKAAVSAYDGEDYTLVSFKPDLKRFGVKHINADMVALFKKRVACASS